MATDTQYANMPDDRRKSVILWEMFGRPMGDDGIRLLQQALEQTTDQQVINLLKRIARKP
ncbi:MAG: hypothetical protein AB7O13_24790 [Alphaproteobacteria bacterium]